MTDGMVSTDELQEKLEDAFATIARSYATLAANGMANIGVPIAISMPERKYPMVGLRVKVWAAVAIVHTMEETRQ